MAMMAEAVDRWRAALRAVDAAWTKFHKVSLGGQLEMQEACGSPKLHPVSETGWRMGEA